MPEKKTEGLKVDDLLDGTPDYLGRLTRDYPEAAMVASGALILWGVLKHGEAALAGIYGTSLLLIAGIAYRGKKDKENTNG